MQELKVISGQVKYVGESLRDEDMHTYRKLELQTSNGLVELPSVMAAVETSRPLKPGREVRILAMEALTGAKVKYIVFAVHDQEAQRTFTDQRLFDLRGGSQKKAVVMSVMSIILVPLLALAFVIPALLYLWLLFKCWVDVGKIPDEAQVREAVAKLASG